MLRRIRQILALVLIAMLTLTLLGAVRWGAGVARLQVVPALLAGGVAALAAVVLLTLVAGRAYCSTLCPLGVLQDIVRRLSGRRPMRYRSGLPGYAAALVLLVVGMWGWARGEYLVPALLDPFSHYARIVGQLFRPLWVLLKGALADLDGPMGWWIEHEPIVMHSAAAMTGALVLLAVLTVTSWLWGRALCHWLCPVGYVLGWIGCRPLLGVRTDATRCTHCGACERACRSSCRRATDGRLDRRRCVVCLDCVAVCPRQAIRYGLPRRGDATSRTISPKDAAADAPQGLSRRRLLTAAGTLALTLPAARAQRVLDEYERASRNVIAEGDGFVTYQYDNVRQVEARMPGGEVVARRTYAIMPPATVSRARFQSRCTSCGLCMAHCPSHILRPATDEYGPAGRMQPTVDFSLGWCRPECNRCAEVCPTDAIRLLPVAEKRTDRLGWATFNSRTCVAVTDDVDCDACVRHCPMQAITMVEKEGHKVPTVTKRRCTGCGACEYYCPGRPLKAIYVEGLKY